MPSKSSILQIRLRMDRRKSSRRKDGTYPIVINVPNGSHSVHINTGISAPPETWDDRTEQYIGPRAKRINCILTVQLGGVQQRAVELRVSGKWSSLQTPAAVREALTCDLSTAAGTTGVVEYMERYMKTLERRKTRLTFKNTIDKLNLYTNGEQLEFDALNAKWLREFSNWLRRDQGLAVNTVAIHLRNLRTVVNRAIDDDITQVYGFRRFSIKTEATRHRALSLAQLQQLLTAPVTPSEAAYRDIFWLGFCLIGINLVDLSRVTEVENGRIHYRRSKTGKLYSIKVEPEAQAIIDKYRGTDHLLEQFDRVGDYQHYTHRINKALKRMGGTEIGKHGKRIHHPIEPDLSYYWCRHTWASIASSIGIPEDTIRHALGHGGRSVTDTYIDYDLRHVDEANRQVIDTVLDNTNP